MRFAMASGQLIDVSDFRPEHVHLDDIAHHLSKIQRFGGGSPINISYSVAEHSINLAAYFLAVGDIECARIAILHDASEAYLSDIVSPVKPLLPDYRQLEATIQGIVINKYLANIGDVDTFVRFADKCIVMDEVETIMPDYMEEIFKKENPVPKLGCHIGYNNHPGTSKHVFLTLCKKLGISDKTVLHLNNNI